MISGSGRLRQGNHSRPTWNTHTQNLSQKRKRNEKAEKKRELREGVARMGGRGEGRGEREEAKGEKERWNGGRERDQRARE